MACCCQEWGPELVETFDEYGNQCQIYRKSSPYDGLATIFDVDDSLTYFNWRIELGKEWYLPTLTVAPKYPARFRELIDQETNSHAFELTGNHDGSVFLTCPPSPRLVLAEKLPYINLIMSDRGGYCSIEISMLTRDDSYPFCSDIKVVTRTVFAKNFISRTCIQESSMEIPMRLEPSWNYACLDLRQLTKDAWNAKYLATSRVKINANFRIRRVYFSDKEYAYYELPNEFKLDLRSLSPVAEDAANNLESEMNMEPTDFEIENLDLYDETNRAKSIKIAQDGINTGMKLSIPSNKDLLLEMVQPVKPVRKSIGEGRNITWIYPRSQKSVITRKAKKEIPQLISIGEQKRQEKMYSDLHSSQASRRSDYQGDDYCAYVWKNAINSNLTEGEWTKIEASSVQPDVVAKIQQQRRSVGLYDLYTGRMLTKKDKKYFGFGDKAEASYLTRKSSVKVTERSCIDLNKKPSIETVLPETPSKMKVSRVDGNADFDFLLSASKDTLVVGNWFEEYEQEENETGFTEENEDNEENDGEMRAELDPNLTKECTLCKCKCECRCKATEVAEQCGISQISVPKDLVRVRFVPPPSKHISPDEELRGTGANLLRPFLDVARDMKMIGSS